MEERVQKLIARAGIASRRKAEELILAGRVRVNGKVEDELGCKAGSTDRIEVDGKLIQAEEKAYYLLNKPRKTICSLSDERGRDTVLSCLPDVEQRVFPVGRLDYETTGVLILTNDGEFANLLMHPSHHLPKTYELSVDGLLDEDQVRQLEHGILLEDGMTLPARVEVISRNPAKKKTVMNITIMEGRNREIRRMMEHFGCTVTRLNRKSLAFLETGVLRQGEYRKLKPFEVKRLRQIALEGKDVQSAAPMRSRRSSSGSM